MFVTQNKKTLHRHFSWYIIYYNNDINLIRSITNIEFKYSINTGFFVLSLFSEPKKIDIVYITWILVWYYLYITTYLNLIQETFDIYLPWHCRNNAISTMQLIFRFIFEVEHFCRMPSLQLLTWIWKPNVPWSHNFLASTGWQLP